MDFVIIFKLKLTKQMHTMGLRVSGGTKVSHQERNTPHKKKV
jgi:hypothetical protein